MSHITNPLMLPKITEVDDGNEDIIIKDQLIDRSHVTDVANNLCVENIYYQAMEAGKLVCNPIDCSRDLFS